MRSGLAIGDERAWLKRRANAVTTWTASTAIQPLHWTLFRWNVAYKNYATNDKLNGTAAVSSVSDRTTIRCRKELRSPPGGTPSGCVT